MKRKIVKQGQATMTISLPSKWVKKFDLQSGSELELTERGEKLILSTSEELAKETKDVDLTGMEKMVGRSIGAMYKAGYDDIKITFKEPGTFKLIQQELEKGLVGMEIIHQGKNSCNLKQVTAGFDENFETLLRRLFRLLIEVGNDGYESLKDKDYENIKNLILRDRVINRFSDICRRLLNKREYTEKALPQYFISEELEKIGDVYLAINKLLSIIKINPSKELLNAYKETNEYLELFYKLYYDFNKKQLEEFYEKRVELTKKISQTAKRAPRNEQQILFLLGSVVERVFDLNGPLLMIRL